MSNVEKIPTLEQIRATHEQLAPHIIETPVFEWRHQELLDALDESPGTGQPTEIFFKLELWQHTGSFKPRGALSVMQSLDSQTLAKGVTAVSAGNHAIAVGFAAQLLGTTAKVVMPKTADPFRIKKCRAYGAEVLLEQDEGRFFVHPFESFETILGTATVGLEFCEQVAGQAHAAQLPSLRSGAARGRFHAP